MDTALYRVAIKAENLKTESLIFVAIPPPIHIHIAMSAIRTSAYRLTNGSVCVHLVGEAVVTERLNAHMIVAIDTSGSMTEAQKLKHVVESLEALLGFMGDNDMISLVLFHSTVSTPYLYLKTTPDNKDVLRAYLRSLRADGGTNISGTISALHDVLASAPADHKNGIVFLTDGDATVGVLDAPTLLVHVQSLLVAYPQTTLTAIGYGHDHKAELLRSMAVVGGGSYQTVLTVEHVASALGDLFGGLASTVAQEVRLVVGSAAQQLSSYHRRSDTQIFVGNLLSGGEHIVVLTTDEMEFTVLSSDVHTGVPLTPINVVVHPATPPEQETGMRAYLRCSVVQLMEDVNRYVLAGTTTAAPTELTARIEALKTACAAEPPHPLLDLLIRRLDRCLSVSRVPPPPPQLSRMLSNQISQDSTCLGTARGTMSIGYDEDPPAAIFSTPTQRTASQGMSQAVHQDTPRPVPGGLLDRLLPLYTPAAGGAADSNSSTNQPANPPPLKRS